MDDITRAELAQIEHRMAVLEDMTAKNRLLYQTLIAVTRDCSEEARQAIQKILAAYRGDHELPPVERWR